MSRSSHNGRKNAKQRQRTHTQRYQTYTPKSEREVFTHEVDLEAERARRFAEAESEVEKYTIACETEMSGTDADTAVAGAMLLDIAMRAKGQQWEAYFEEARARFEKSLANQGTTFSHPDIARAAVTLAHLDMYRQRATDPTTMPTELTEAAYKRNLEVTDMISATFHQAKSGNQPYASNYSGLLGEQSISLLLGRFSAQHMDGSWFVLPALYSEDHAMSVDGIHHGFDSKVFAQDDPAFEFYAAYHIQSKTGKRHGKRYAPHITIVHALADLSIDYEGAAGHIAPYTEPAECMFEYQAAQQGVHTIGDEAVTARLDQRTDKLLEILG